MTTAIVIAASSDIGTALCRRWLERGWTVAGTYRTASEPLAELTRGKPRVKTMLQCDLASSRLMEVCTRLSLMGQWDVLAVCAGQLAPLQPFLGCPSNSWEASFRANLLGPARALRYLLPNRDSRDGKTPTVIFFAGAGTNSAPQNYSAYAVSKVALIKLCELLDAEVPDTKFTILGPGWVNTKIHQQTLAAGANAGEGYTRTRQMLERGGRWTSVERVLECIDWVVQAPREVVGGRNFSVEHDRWGPDLEPVMKADPALYKLRRAPY